MTKRPSTSVAVPGGITAPRTRSAPPVRASRPPAEPEDDVAAVPEPQRPPLKRDCMRCHGVMDLGFLVDRGHGNVISVATWSKGSPTKSFWTGVKVKGAILLPVGTYRCRTCGFLESYAHPMFAVAPEG